MTYATDASNFESALANFADSAASLNLNSPDSVASFGSSATSLALAISAALADVGPFTGSLGLSASVASLASDADSFINAGSPTGEVSAALGIAGDIFSIAGGMAGLVAAAEGGANPAADAAAAIFAGASAVFGLLKFMFDRATYIQNALSHLANALKDPIVIDLSGSGLHLIAQSATSPYFDWTGGEFADSTSWVGPGTAFLVELPAAGQPITVSNLVTTFSELSTFDFNNDGVISLNDPSYGSLGVWNPYSGQVETLAQAGIVSISLTSHAVDQNINGNQITALSEVTFADGTVHEAASVSFSYSLTYTQFLGSDSPSAAAAALPQLDGYGDLPDLRDAMTQDPTLLDLVQNFSEMPVTNALSLGNAIANIMFNWAGVEDVTPALDGPQINAQQLAFLEDLLGTPFVDERGGTYPVFAPEVFETNQSWQTSFNGIAARLLLQGPMAGALSDFSFDSQNDLIRSSVSFLQALQDVAANAPSETQANSAYWWGAVTVIDAYVSDWQALDSSTGSDVVPPSQDAVDALLGQVNPNLTAVVLSGIRSESFNGYSVLVAQQGGAYTYDTGNGASDILVDAGADQISEATLTFGPGITPQNIEVFSDSTGSLFIGDGIEGDIVKLDGMMFFNGSGQSEFGINEITFSNGTTLSSGQLIDLADTASPINQDLYGLSPQGTFTYGLGDGNVSILQDAGWRTSTLATLVIDGGITPNQLGVTADSNGDIILTDGTPEDLIDLVAMQRLQLGGMQEYGVSEAVFSNGTTLTAQQLLALADIGTPTNTRLYGTPGSDVFDSRGYANYEQGTGGGDTFIYNIGYGAVEINEDAGFGVETTAALRLGAGITENSISVVSDDAGNLYITDGTLGDQIKLDGELIYGFNNAVEFGVSQVLFADGTTLTAEQLINLATTGTPGKTALYGTPGSDVFDSRGYANYEQGNGGADTFIYNVGYGAIEINEDAGFAINTAATLQLGAGITESDISITADSSGNLYIADGTAGDQIKLDGELRYGFRNSKEYGVAQVQFADGTTLTAQQIIKLNTTGAPGKTALYGTPGADIFDSRGYATYAQGNGGADTFIYNAGYGAVEIKEDAGFAINTNATLRLGAGIAESNISFSSDSNGNLYITDGMAGDQIRLDGELNYGYGASTEYGVSQVQFADGTAWTQQQLIAIADIGTSTNTRLYGAPGPDIFDSRGYATYEQGNGGSDTFIYNVGYGTVEINEDAGFAVDTKATLRLGSGITESTISVSSDSNGNLYITDGTAGDQIRLDGELNYGYGASTEYGVSQVQFADGTAWTQQQLIVVADIGTSANTRLYGAPGPDIFDSRSYATYEQGNGGSDTFIYNVGYGTVEINEDAGLAVDTQAMLRLGSGITESTISVSSDSNGNLYITDGTAGDQIKLDSELNYGYGASTEYGVSQVHFADGTVWTQQQLVAAADVGTPTDTRLYGTPGADIFDSRAYATYEQGNGGADTFIYNVGYGTVEINEYAGYGIDNSATLRLGAGITESNVSINSDTQGDIYITDGVSEDQVKLDNMLSVGFDNTMSYGVSQVQFSDGTVWTASDVAAKLQNDDTSLSVTSSVTISFGTVTVSAAESALSITIAGPSAELLVSSSLSIGTTLAVVAGTLDITGAGQVDSGTIVVSTGGLLEASGNTSISSRVVNDGQIDVAAGTLALASGATLDGSLSGSGTLALCNNSTNYELGSDFLSSSGNLAATYYASLVFNSAALTNLDMSVSEDASLNIGVGVDIIDNGALSLGLYGGLWAGAVLIAGGGTLTTAGTTTIATTGSAAVNAVGLSGGISWLNTGVTEDQGNISGGGSLINGSGAIFNVLSYYTDITPWFDNEGLLNLGVNSLELDGGGSLNGSLSGSGTLLLYNNNSNYNLGLSFLASSGNVIATYFAYLVVSRSATASLDLSLSGNASLYIGSGVDLTDAGTLLFGLDGGVWAGAGHVAGAGTLTTTGTTTIATTGDAAVNAMGLGGSVSWLNAGVTDDQGNISGGGSVANELGAVFNILSTYTDINPWFDNEGLLNLGVNSLELDGGGSLNGSLSGSGTLVLCNNNANYNLGSSFLASSGNVTATYFAYLVVSSSASASLDLSLSENASLYIGSGVDLTDAGTLLFGLDGGVWAGAGHVAGAGTLTTTGTTTIATTGDAAVNAMGLSGSVSWLNAGVADDQGNISGGGSVANELGAVFNILSTYTDINPWFDNEGLLNLGVNSLELDGGGSLNGSLSGSGTLVLCNNNANYNISARFLASAENLTATYYAYLVVSSSASTNVDLSLSDNASLNIGSGVDLTEDGSLSLGLHGGMWAGTGYITGGGTLTTTGTTTIASNGDGESAGVDVNGSTWNNAGTLIMGGSVNGNGTLDNIGTGEIDIRSSAYISSSLSNLGTINISSGTVTFLGSVDNEGTINVVGGSASFGSILGAEGTIGDINIGPEAAAIFSGGVGSEETVNFMGSGALINISSPADFLASLNGFGLGDSIDLINTQAASLAYAQNTLQVLNSSGATVAAFAFGGNYVASDFGLTSDGHGGTTIIHS